MVELGKIVSLLLSLSGRLVKVKKAGLSRLFGDQDCLKKILIKVVKAIFRKIDV